MCICSTLYIISSNQRINICVAQTNAADLPLEVGGTTDLHRSFWPAYLALKNCEDALAARVVNFCVTIGRKAVGITSPFQPTDDMKDRAWSFAYANARDFASGRHGICYAHMKMAAKKHVGLFINKNYYRDFLTDITKLHDVVHAPVIPFPDCYVSERSALVC